MYPTLALLSTAFAASGKPTPANSGDLDYRTELTGGVIAIDGRRSACGTPFSLKLNVNGRVTGEVDGSRVSFWASAASHRRLMAQFEAREELAA